MFRAPLTYLVVVLVGYAVDFAAFSLLVALGVWLVLANSVAFVAGAVINAILVRRLVFSDNRFHPGTDLLLTLMVNVLFFLFGTWLLWWLVGSVGMNPYGAKILTNGFTFAGNFTARAIFFRTT